MRFSLVVCLAFAGVNCVKNQGPPSPGQPRRGGQIYGDNATFVSRVSFLSSFVMVGHSKSKGGGPHRDGCLSSGMESFRDPFPLYMRPIDDRCGGPADLVWIFFNGQPWSMHSNHFETLVLCCYCPSDLMQVLVSNSKTIFEFYFELRTTIGGL